MSTIIPVDSFAEKGLESVEIETLSEAYLWLQEVRAAHASFLVARAERVKKLDAHARYVLGSLKAARRFLDDSSAAEASAEDHEHTESVREDEPAGEGGAEGGKPGREEPSWPVPAVRKDDPLAEMVERTRAELEQAREELDSWAKEQNRRFDEAFEAAESAVIERTESYTVHQQPMLRLEVARLAGGRCIVHMHRPSDEEAVVLCRLLAGRPPSRYDFLRDDSIETVDGPVHLAVREHGVDPEEITRGGAEAGEALVRDTNRRLLPIRAHLPVVVPGMDWPRMRLMTRGPVLELEVRTQGGDYNHLVTEEHCELFTGYLVSLRAREMLDVDIQFP